MTIAELENYGFNTAEGLELCVDDEDIYREVLETAMEEGKEKIPFIDELMKNKDYDRYIIEVHGLKNAAKQIGCDKLSEMAKDSELSGKDGKFDYIESKHEELMDEYKRVVSVMEKLFE